MKNKHKRYTYILGIQIPDIENFSGDILRFPELYKVGVFTGYVNSRVNSILNDINDFTTVRIVRKFEINGDIQYFNLPNVRKNYVVELNAHNYLADRNIQWVDFGGWNWIPSLKLISEMSGKTEWFLCTEQQAISAVLHGIRYCETHPQKLLKNQFVNKIGCITKYGKGKQPNYTKNL